MESNHNKDKPETDPDWFEVGINFIYILGIIIVVGLLGICLSFCVLMQLLGPLKNPPG